MDDLDSLDDLDGPAAPIVLAGPAGEVRDVGFALDRRWLAAVSLDGSAQVWPASERDGVLRFAEPVSFAADGPLHRLRLLDAGRVLATAGFGPSVELWYLGDSLSVAALRERLERGTSLCLSVAQRMQFAGESRAAAEAGLAACSSLGDNPADPRPPPR